MNDKRHNDDILFDRLVDGELSADERRTLLESLDTRTQGWRRCALAFLESQSWQRGLRTMVAKPPLGRELGTERPAGAAVAEMSALSPAARRTTIWAAAQWLAVAAGLLVAFKIGALRREPGMPIAGNPPQTNEQLVSVPQTTGGVAPNAAKTRDALNLWVRDEAGQMRRVRVPLVDASALDQQLGLEFQTGVPDDVRGRLQDHGYTVQSKRQYAPMWLDNGRPMIVPVEDTKIVPVSNKVY